MKNYFGQGGSGAGIIDATLQEAYTNVKVCADNLPHIVLASQLNFELVAQQVEEIADEAATAEKASQLAAALSNGQVFANEQAGLEATPEDGQFVVDKGDGTGQVFVKRSGLAASQQTVILDPAADVTAQHIGTENGTLQDVLNDILSRLQAGDL